MEQKKTEPIVKFGSDDMIFWRNLIDAKEKDIQITKENLKFYEFIVKYAKLEYDKAEKAFNQKI